MKIFLLTTFHTMNHYRGYQVKCIYNLPTQLVSVFIYKQGCQVYRASFSFDMSFFGVVLEWIDCQIA